MIVSLAVQTDLLRVTYAAVEAAFQTRRRSRIETAFSPSLTKGRADQQQSPERKGSLKTTSFYLRELFVGLVSSTGSSSANTPVHRAVYRHEPHWQYKCQRPCIQLLSAQQAQRSHLSAARLPIHFHESTLGPSPQAGAFFCPSRVNAVWEALRLSGT